jgi:hypothetical protein
MGNPNNILGPNGAIPVFNGGAFYKNIAASTNTQIKTGAGVFERIGVNAGGTTSTATLYDGVNAEVLLPVASPGVVTAAAPLAAELVPGSAVLFTGGSLPTGLTANTPVYVSAAGFATGVFQVADTKAHALAGTNSINFTGSESGVHFGWDASNKIGTYATTSQLNPADVGAAFSDGLFAVTADGGGAADLTVLYV